MEEYRKYEPIFGSWYLSRLLGKGSFGKVFEITREEFGTTYKSALKVITVPQDEDDIKSRMTEGTDIGTISEYYESILREIINENEIMAQLKGNSNIVSYEDHQIIPHDDGIGYDILIRMELLTPLLDRMMKKRLEEKEVVKLGIDICRALELCHRKNIIHRDIKPQNIFLSENGDFKLGDFGIARTMEKTTGGMSKKGTYKYMAPEVFKGEQYNETVDIYSLGIVLYSLLNGNRGPFLPAPPARVTPNDEEMARQRRLRGEEIPIPRDAGPMLGMIIRKACAYRPEDRYSSAEQMRRDLESYYNNYSVLAEQTEDDGLDERTVFDPSVRARTGRYTGSYAAAGAVPRETGSIYGMTGAEQPLELHPAGNRRDSGGGKKSKVPLIIGALVLIAVIGAAAAMLLIGGGEASPSGYFTEVSSIQVLDSDWDWDSGRYDNGFTVDAILLVQNNSDTAITGIDFSVCTEDKKPIQDVNETDAPLHAYGYVGSGSTGIMVGEIHTGESKDVPDNSTYSISGAYYNNDLEGYVVPTGTVTDNYGPNNDFYDISVDNPNDVPVSASSKIVMAKVRDNKIMDCDATGKINTDIEPKTMGFIQNKAFYDPNLRANYKEVIVYVIDTDYYNIHKSEEE